MIKNTDKSARIFTKFLLQIYYYQINLGLQLRKGLYINDVITFGRRGEFAKRSHFGDRWQVTGGRWGGSDHEVLKRA